MVGWVGNSFLLPLPFPDGEGAVGFRDGRVIQDVPERNWKEYAGACLLAPLRAGTAYRFQFDIGFGDFADSPAIYVTFFGNTSCENLPFAPRDETVGCPTNDTTNWIQLGAVRALGSNIWVQRTIDVTPDQDIYAIAIGPPCMGTNSNRSTYYFFDNLILDEQRAFDFEVRAVNHPCSDQFEINAPELKDTDYQWYRNGIALVGETASKLNVSYGEGEYQVRVLNEEGCKITKAYNHFIPTFETELNEFICKGETYKLGPQSLDLTGNYSATFQSVDGCDSIVSLNLEVVEQSLTEVQAKIFKGDAYEVGNRQFKESGYHQARLNSYIGCDSLVNLELAYFKIYTPTAFSPNGDGINDYFNVTGEPDLESILSLKVFSKWGELIYEGNNLDPHNLNQGWNGRLEGKSLSNGVYIYTANIKMVDGQERLISGELMLLN